MFMFLSPDQAQELVCKVGFTAFTPHYPENYKTLADIFQATPCSRHLLTLHIFLHLVPFILVVVLVPLSSSLSFFLLL